VRRRNKIYDEEKRWKKEEMEKEHNNNTKVAEGKKEIK
jgi:hypothetical protein